MSYSRTQYTPSYQRVGYTSIGPAYYVANPGAKVRGLSGLGHGHHGGGGWGGGGNWGGGLYMGDGLPMEPTEFISSPLFGIGNYEGDMQQLGTTARPRRRGSLDGILAVL